MSASKLNILLTGGSGFIGRNILESFLAVKYNILAPGHSKLDLTNDGQVREFFQNNQVDVVIHSAIKPGHRNAKDPNNLFYTDSRMFFNIVRNSSRYRKMIVLGSGSVYDMHKLNLDKVTEDFFDFSIPEDEHGFFRYVSSRFIELMDNAIELRIFSIFGKYEDYAIRFISNATCKAVFDLPITIKQNKKFDFLYIDDLMPILDYFIQNESSNKVYNVTPDSSIELYTAAERVRSISGKNLHIKVAKPGMGLAYSGSNARLRNEIKDMKLTDIDTAISELYEWYSRNQHLINRDLLLFDK